MPHQVALSDATFARLQRLATPLVDNIESVIARLADYYEEEGASASRPQSGPATREPAAQTFNPNSPPDLRFTKVLQIKIGGVAVRKPTWNGLLNEMVQRCRGRITGADDARRLILVNFVSGQKEDEGFRFIPEVGLSIQGQDANAAWRSASHLGRQLGIAVEVAFVWRHKEGAAYPGITGCLAVC
jgi:hypothetical protein